MVEDGICQKIKIEIAGSVVKKLDKFVNIIDKNTTKEINKLIKPVRNLKI